MAGIIYTVIDAGRGEQEQNHNDKDGWTFTDCMQDLSGPLVIISEQEKGSVLLSFSDSGKVSGTTIDDADSFEPDDISQVIVGHLVPLSANKVWFKTAYGRYVSSDAYGAVSASREAIGPSEEWLVEFGKEGAAALKTAYDGYLSVVHQESARPGQIEIRADAETAGPRETFRIKCQAANKHTQKACDKDRLESNHVVISDKQTLARIENEERKRYQHHKSMGSSIASKRSVAELEQAQKEGRLREALLDRRTKQKHDPFC